LRGPLRRTVQIPTFSCEVGSNQTLAQFLFLFVEKKGHCIGMCLFGGWCFATGRVIADEFCLALIRFKADVINDLTSWSVLMSFVELRYPAKAIS